MRHVVRLGAASVLAFVLVPLMMPPTLAHGGDDHTSPLTAILHQDGHLLAIGVLIIGAVAVGAWWRSRITASEPDNLGE